MADHRIITLGQNLEPILTTSKNNFHTKNSPKEETRRVLVQSPNASTKLSTNIYPKSIGAWLSNPGRPHSLPWSEIVSDLRSRPWAKYTLSWIENSVRPLTPSELAVVAALQEMPPVIDAPDGLVLVSLAEKISSNPVRDVESSLKMITRVEDNEVTLLHYTLRGVLQRTPGMTVPHPHVSIARQCLRLLKLWTRSSTFVDRQDGVRSLIARVNSLLAYARRFWHKHYMLAVGSKDTDEKLKDALDKEVLKFIRSGPGSPEFKLWADHYKASELRGQEDRYHIRTPPARHTAWV